MLGTSSEKWLASMRRS